MKRMAVITIIAIILILAGCNTTAPGERIDRDGNITIGMNFKQIRKAYIKAVYEKKLGYQHIYFQWLKDNKERVSPFADLEKWQAKIENQYQKDMKIVKNIEQKLEKMKCWQMREAIQRLYPIWYRSHAKKIADLRSKIAEKMNRKKCKVNGWKKYRYIPPIILNGKWTRGKKMKTLESFTKKVKPQRRKSKLQPYEKEIRELYAEGYRVEQIQEFLETNGIKASVRGIRWFLKLNRTLNNKKFSFKNPAAPKSKIGNEKKENRKKDSISFQEIKKLIKG